MKSDLSQSRRSLLVRQDTFVIDGDQSDDDYDQVSPAELDSNSDPAVGLTPNIHLATTAKEIVFHLQRKACQHR